MLKSNTKEKIPDEPCIFMANHRSYLDAILIPSNFPLVFVAKASVKNWPIFGWGGRAMDTVWVNRNSKKSRNETRKQLKIRLEKEKTILIFPEGKTHTGPEILKLNPGMFHTVADGGFSITAIAIEYQNPNIAFVGNDLFIPHFIKTFGSSSIRVKVRFSELFVGNDGEQLRENVFHWLTETTSNYRKQWDSVYNKS